MATNVVSLQFVALLVILVVLSAEGRRSGPTGEKGMCEMVMNATGYACKEYTVETHDGFLLGLQRISRGTASSNGTKRLPVLLQHGLLQGGDCWVLNLPGQSLAFILADEGFDVWIANGRGTQWSHGHKKYSKHDREYWDWTWDELAEFDLPAMLAFVMETTESKVFYVGHSQVIGYSPTI